MQEVEAQEVEDGGLQQLHQAVNLHQHLYSHRQLRKARRQLVCVPVSLPTCKKGGVHRRRLVVSEEE